MFNNYKRPSMVENLTITFRTVFIPVLRMDIQPVKYILKLLV